MALAEVKKTTQLLAPTLTIRCHMIHVSPLLSHNPILILISNLCPNNKQAKTARLFSL